MIKKYFINLAISIDQLVNTILGGYPDETISSRAGKWVRANSQAKGGVWYWLCGYTGNMVAGIPSSFPAAWRWVGPSRLATEPARCLYFLSAHFKSSAKLSAE